MPFCIPSSSSSTSQNHDGSNYNPSHKVFGGPSKVGKSKLLNKKLVVLGDGACGKTSMLVVFTEGYFPTDYEPTVFENYVETLNVDGTMVELSLWDTAGQEEYDRLRSLSYADTNVVMICFSVERPESLENVEAKWIHEVNRYCSGVRIVLVALKCDLRDDRVAVSRLKERGMSTIGYNEGLEMAKRIRAVRYLECSAKMNRGVKEAIEEATRMAMTKQRGDTGEKRGRGCLIM